MKNTRPRFSLALLFVMESLAYGFSRTAVAESGCPTLSCPRPWLQRSIGEAASTPPDGKNMIFSLIVPKTRLNLPSSSVINKNYNSFVLGRRGGASSLSSSTSSDETTNGTNGTNGTSFGKIITSFWGVGGVIYILLKAIVRVLPIAVGPFTEGSVPLSQLELGAYIVTCLWFAYVEGYKGFQTKFSPLVVKRSFTFLRPGQSKFHHYLLAPAYSMGLIHATKKRKIVSWSVTIGIALIVAAVKRLPYPWRNIIDAGVVAGLSWGSLSILFIYFKSLVTGKEPDIDPALPLAQ